MDRSIGIELEHMNSEPMRLNVPRVYTLTADPNEEYNLASDATWLLPVLFEKIVAFQGTIAQESSIELGTPDPYQPPLYPVKGSRLGGFPDG